MWSLGDMGCVFTRLFETAGIAVFSKWKWCRYKVSSKNFRVVYCVVTTVENKDLARGLSPDEINRF